MSPLVTLVAFSFVSAAASSGPDRAKSEISIIELPSGRSLQAEVLRSPRDRARGLMFRPSLPADRVLLFVLDAPGFHSFWMKNCRFPIDIVWLDEERRVVHVAESVPPCRRDPCPSYAPMRKALFVVEMNAGLARREGLTIGAPLVFTLDR